jgi:hypothetical protein
MVYRLALIGSLALLITGCATTRNTPEQDLVWAAAKTCKTETGSTINVERVDAQGRITAAWCNDKCTRIEEMQDCILHKLATPGPR